ncbi:MAG: helix-turn-helix transcriptional regulator [Chloroflexota bacterium]|nr:helix-turn-helix transcriptional regulator [Chloroflexota bacterium]
MARKRATERVMLRREAAWDLLHQLNWSQGDLGREAGLSAGYVSLLFNWDRSPSASARRSIQKALGVEDFDVLFVIVTVEDDE